MKVSVAMVLAVLILADCAGGGGGLGAGIDKVKLQDSILSDGNKQLSGTG